MSLFLKQFGGGACNISIFLKNANILTFSPFWMETNSSVSQLKRILFSKQLQFPSVHSESLSIHPHNLSALFFIQLFLCVYISPSGYPYAP